MTDPFPTADEIAGHTPHDLTGDGTWKMHDLLGGLGTWLNLQFGGTGGQALGKNSNADGDFTFFDLAPLSDVTPLQASGAGDSGGSTEAARADHVHPNGTALGSFGLVQSYTSTDDASTFSTGTGLLLIDVNPSPTLLAGHHYLWLFSGEWLDSNTSGTTALNLTDETQFVLARAAQGASNARKSGTAFYLEDGTGTTVTRQLRIVAAATNTGTTEGATTPYIVALVDLGNA